MAQPPLSAWSLSQTAGFITWVGVGVPQLVSRSQGPVEGMFSLWLGCYLAFGVLFVLIGNVRLEPYLHHETLVPLAVGGLARDRHGRRQLQKAPNPLPHERLVVD